MGGKVMADGRGRGRGRGAGGRRGKQAAARRSAAVAEQPGESGDDVVVPGDVYEAPEKRAEEESARNKRYDDAADADNSDDLGSEFDGKEEIDEDMAFTEEDKLQFGHLFGKTDNKRRLTADIAIDEDEDEDDIGSIDEDVEADSDADERHDKMLAAVVGKGQQARAKDDQRKKRVEVTSEVYPESEYNVAPAAGVNQLTVGDLVGALGDVPGLTALKKKLQRLERPGRGPVAPPLAPSVKGRLERMAGYETTSKDVSKWLPIVKRNREAATIVINQKPEVAKLTTAGLSAKFQPTTPFEKEMAELLQKAGVADTKAIEEQEALALNALSAEEVQERRQRLAKMRSLLFYHELKQKRIKQIKSKVYHKITNKTNQRNATKLAEADPEAAKDLALKAEFARAQERMSLKHKNTSRWARRALKKGLQLKEGTREAIEEQLRVNQALTRKVNAANAAGSDDEDDDTVTSSEDEGEEMHTTRATAKAKAATLAVLEQDADQQLPNTGLFALPFMARAIEKKRKEAQEDAQRLLERLDDGAAGSDAEQDDAGMFAGRRVFGEATAAPARIVLEDDEGLAGMRSDDEEQLDAAEEEADRTAARDTFSAVAGNAGMSNSGRAYVAGRPVDGEAAGNSAGVSRGRQARDAARPAVIAGNSNGMATATPARSAANDAAGTVDGGAAMPNGRQNPEEATPAAEHEAEEPIPTGQQLNHDDEAVERLSVGDAEPLLDTGDTLTQQEIIRRAFAGDDVQADFDAEKQAAVEEELPKIEGPMALPGWGQWATQKHRKPKFAVKAEEEAKKRREEALAKRQDAKLQHVVLSEKFDKKLAARRTQQVPFPFTSKEAFERSLRMPVGRDFNTHATHEKMTQPAVIKSAGVIVQPIKYVQPAKGAGGKESHKRKAEDTGNGRVVHRKAARWSQKKT
eukprot:jgi/Chlat1/7039/Chrsp56S06716